MHVAPGFLPSGQVQPYPSLEGGFYLPSQLAQQGHTPGPQKAAARLEEALLPAVSESALNNLLAS